MIGWAARLFLLRMLPRRLVPFITFIELALLARGLLRGRRGSQPQGPGRASARGPHDQLPPWRAFGRPADAGASRAPAPRQIGPESGATLRR
jgi:hypothetical protein